MDAGPAHLEVALRGFIAAPDPGRLAEFADRKLLLREMGNEKFERFVAPDVWQRAYVRDVLDAAGALEVAQRCLTELGS